MTRQNIVKQSKTITLRLAMETQREEKSPKNRNKNWRPTHSHTQDYHKNYLAESGNTYAWMWCRLMLACACGFSFSEQCSVNSEGLTLPVSFIPSSCILHFIWGTLSSEGEFYGDIPFILFQK